MRIVAIIPARMASTRFPGKPLSDILGLPMIEHVRRRVVLSSLVDKVIVATCDKEIYDVVSRNGGLAVMTSNNHERCTDRIAEAASSINADIIVNIQGDEPFIRPEMVEMAVGPLMNNNDVSCVNLIAEITSIEEFKSPNTIKVVFDLGGNIIYFSREPIPSLSKFGSPEYKKYKQLGVIAFRNDFLRSFTLLPQTPLERIESVDMLRLVEHGYRVKMAVSPFRVIGVDTPEDLKNAIELMRRDTLLSSYSKIR